VRRWLVANVAFWYSTAGLTVLARSTWENLALHDKLAKSFPVSPGLDLDADGI
jgi:hypothetical protein